MDLEVIEEALMKRNLSTTWDTYLYRERENKQFEEMPNAEIERIKAFIINKWQDQWEIEENGRETFASM